MPRSARLDQPGLLQHVIVRGIEKRDIFLDDEDRDDFVRRLPTLLLKTVNIGLGSHLQMSFPGDRVVETQRRNHPGSYGETLHYVTLKIMVQTLLDVLSFFAPKDE